MDVIERLSEAIDTGEVIDIAYRGGSQPGASRKISPIQVDGDTVKARCFSSGRVKTYMVELIELIDENTDRPLFTEDNKVSETIPYPSLLQAGSYNRPRFESMGWVVSVTDESVQLFKKWKNGNSQKTPSCEINYEEYSTEHAYDIKTGEMVERDPIKRERPWVVRARKKKTVSFSNFPKAFERFFSYAEELAPEKNDYIPDACYEMDLLSSLWRPRAKRSALTIAPAVKGKQDPRRVYLEHWAFPLTYAFRDAIDIKLEERTVNKKKVAMWTQGGLLKFKDGDFIHSSDRKKAVRVTTANPMGWDSDKGRMYMGSVAFRYHQDIHNEGYNNPSEFILSQPKFLKLLITGKIDLNNE